MTNPTDTSCTSVYTAASTLPMVVAGKCSTSTCTQLQTDLTPVTACMTDPTAGGCTGTYSATTTLPGESRQMIVKLSLMSPYVQ